jgi:hypothetical protein
LSLAGDATGRPAGVGDAWGNGIDVCADRFSERGEFEALANAKVLIDNPATHARAHVLTAKGLKNGLGIIPSSGDLADPSVTRPLEMPEHEHSKRAPH